MSTTASPASGALRYPVELLLELLGSGMSTDRALERYDDLKREDIHAVLPYVVEPRQVKSIYRMFGPWHEATDQAA